MASNDPNPNPSPNPYLFFNPSPNPNPSNLFPNPSSPYLHPHPHFPASSLPCPNFLQPNPHQESIADQNIESLSTNSHPQNPNPSFISSSSSSSSSSAASSASASITAAVDIDYPTNPHLSENVFSAPSFDSFWAEFVADEEQHPQKYYGVLSIDEAMSQQYTMQNSADESLLLCPSNCLFASDSAASNSTSLSANDSPRTMLHMDFYAKPGVTCGGNSSTSVQLASFDEQVVSFRVLSIDLRLFDGYFWRKYGEKNIKNKKFRRNYFKCAESGCKVTKHAERCSDDPENFVIITYNGKHNHPAQHL